MIIVSQPEMVQISADAKTDMAYEHVWGKQPNEHPERRMRVAAFSLSKYPLTFFEWDAALLAGAQLHQPDDASWGRGRRPVIDVSWNDVQGYVAWLNSQTRGGYRLPSKLEWEYACRAGADSQCRSAEEIATAHANYDNTQTQGGVEGQDCGRRTTPVGSQPPNAFGLFDMHGNVWEWCEDIWHGDHASVSHDGQPPERVLRGGARSSSSSEPRSARCRRMLPDERRKDIGVRVARTIQFARAR